MEKETKRGPKGYGIDKFIELLDSKGYKLVPGYDHEYINTKTKMRVIDTTGKECTMTYARLRNDHKSMNEYKESMKVPLEEVRRRVSDTCCFSWIEGTTKYISKSEPMELWCNVCDKKCKVALENIRGERFGCSECYRYNRTCAWSYYEDIAMKYGCTIVPMEEYKGRDTMCFIICNCEEMIEKTARNFIKAPRCEGCSKDLRAATNLERYGSENVFGSEYGKARIKEWLDSNGIKGNMALPGTRAKAEATCTKNYGVPCVLTKDDVREMAMIAHIKKHGVRAFSKEIQKKCQDTLEKRTGFRYPMQVAEYLDKAQKKRFKRKLYTFPSGRVEAVMGYEPQCIDLLLREGCYEDDIVVGNTNVPRIMYYVEGDPRPHRYYMDIYVKSEDRAIEVKCGYTYYSDPKTNEAKWIETSKKCKGGIDVYVFEINARFIAKKRILNGEVTGEVLMLYIGYRPPLPIPWFTIY
jgi:hypothetical protein